MLVAGALAMPATFRRDTTPIYNDDNPVIDSLCPTPSSPPLGGLFPLANVLGSIVNPILVALIGQGTIEAIEYVS